MFIESRPCAYSGLLTGWKRSGQSQQDTPQQQEKSNFTCVELRLLLRFLFAKNLFFFSKMRLKLMIRQPTFVEMTGFLWHLEALRFCELASGAAVFGDETERKVLFLDSLFWVT